MGPQSLPGVMGRHGPLALPKTHVPPGPQPLPRELREDFGTHAPSQQPERFTGALGPSPLLGHKPAAELSSQISSFFTHFCCWINTLGSKLPFSPAGWCDHLSNPSEFPISTRTKKWLHPSTSLSKFLRGFFCLPSRLQAGLRVSPRAKPMAGGQQS